MYAMLPTSIVQISNISTTKYHQPRIIFFEGVRENCWSFASMSMISMGMDSSQGHIAILIYILKVFPPKIVRLKREEMLSLMKNSLFIQMDGVGTEEQEEGVRFAQKK